MFRIIFGDGTSISINKQHLYRHCKLFESIAKISVSDDDQMLFDESICPFSPDLLFKFFTMIKFYPYRTYKIDSFNEEIYAYFQCEDLEPINIVFNNLLNTTFGTDTKCKVLASYGPKIDSIILEFKIYDEQMAVVEHLVNSVPEHISIILKISHSYGHMHNTPNDQFKLSNGTSRLHKKMNRMRSVRQKLFGDTLGIGYAVPEIKTILSEDYLSGISARKNITEIYLKGGRIYSSKELTKLENMCDTLYVYGKRATQ